MPASPFNASYELLFRRGLFVAIDLATSRAHSMKRSTTGLKVRFFNVKIATGHGRMGMSTANSFNACRSSPWRSTDFGTTVMNRPRADRFCAKVHRIGHERCCRHAEALRLESLRDNLVGRCIGRRHDPRLVEKLGKIDLATARPSAVRASRKDPWIIEKDFNIQVIQSVVVRNRRRNSREDEVIGAIAQSREFEGRGRHNVRPHDDARIFLGESFDDLRKEGVRDRQGISNRQLACRGIGQELDVPDALPQFIECRPAARKQRARVGRWLDPARAAIEKLHAQRMLKVGDDLRHSRMGNTEMLGSLGEAA